MIHTAKNADDTNTDEYRGEQVVVHSESCRSVDELRIRFRNTLQMIIDRRVGFVKVGVHSIDGDEKY